MSMFFCTGQTRHFCWILLVPQSATCQMDRSAMPRITVMAPTARAGSTRARAQASKTMGWPCSCSRGSIRRTILVWSFTHGQPEMRCVSCTFEAAHLCSQHVKTGISLIQEGGVHTHKQSLLSHCSSVASNQAEFLPFTAMATRAHTLRCSRRFLVHAEPIPGSGLSQCCVTGADSAAQPIRRPRDRWSIR